MFFGIDLGTTNSTVTYWIKTGPDTFDIRSINNNRGQTLTPSVVFFEEDSLMPIIGTPALEHYGTQPERTMRWVKRFMGSNQMFNVDGEVFSPQYISALILKFLKEMAERDQQMIVGKGLKDVVITVPADFDQNAKQATIDAARIAGFEKIHLIAEPNAAVLNYIFRSKEVGKFDLIISKDRRNFVVFDLGGGTFDVSLSAISFDDRNNPVTNVISSSGDKYLGGINFDKDLMILLLTKAKKLYPDHTESINELIENAKHILDVSYYMDQDIKETLARIIKDCELGKEALSDESKKMFHFITHTGKSLRVEVLREEFENLLKPYLKRIKKHIDDVLTDAREKGALGTWSDLEGVILVGGSSNIPIINTLCEEIFGMEPITGVDTFESVAKGAAIYSAIKNNASGIVGTYTTIIPHDYGVFLDEKFISVLQKGAENFEATLEYEVPFSLDIKTPIQIMQNYHNEEGLQEYLPIEKINYSHPFIYTGDVLDVSFSMDDNLLLTVKVKEKCVYDVIETTIDSSTKMDEDSININMMKINGIRGGYGKDS